MGYDVHVTRRREWSENDGPLISPGEWEKLRSEQPDLDDLVRYSDGEIVAKNPDRALIERLVVVATSLGATVQGDDGEVYTADSMDRETIEQGSRVGAVIAWLKPYLVLGVVWFPLVWIVLWLLGRF